MAQSYKKGLNKITQTTILLHGNALELPGLLCVKEPSDRAFSIYISRLCQEHRFRPSSCRAHGCPVLQCSEGVACSRPSSRPDGIAGAKICVLGALDGHSLLERRFFQFFVDCVIVSFLFGLILMETRSLGSLCLLPSGAIWTGVNTRVNSNRGRWINAVKCSISF